MVSSHFEAILKQFEPFFNCALKSDQNNSCLIKMGIGISIQLELDRNDQLLIGCMLGAIPQGRYRQAVIKAALQSNHARLPHTGVFGFSPSTNQLVFFLMLDPNRLNGEIIASIMPPFVTKAQEWAAAIAKGEIPSLTAKDASLRSPLDVFRSS